MSCNKCDINVQKSRKMNAIYVDMILPTLESDVANKIKSVNKRFYEEIDVNIDSDNSVTQNYEKNVSI